MRTGISITLKAADRRRLKALARDRNAPHKHVWRAEIVLFSADGVGTIEIMRRTGKSKTCVWRWVILHCPPIAWAGERRIQLTADERLDELANAAVATFDISTIPDEDLEHLKASFDLFSPRDHEILAALSASPEIEQTPSVPSPRRPGRNYRI